MFKVNEIRVGQVLRITALAFENLLTRRTGEKGRKYVVSVS